MVLLLLHHPKTEARLTLSKHLHSTVHSTITYFCQLGPHRSAY